VISNHARFQLALRVIVLLLLALLVSNLAASLASLESTIYLLIFGFTLAALYGFADYVINGRYFLNIFVGIARKNASGYYFMAIIRSSSFAWDPHASPGRRNGC
jgi:hypothetical protein